MTEEQYWNGDCTLVKYYREADEIRKERMNQERWLQGMYIYDAMSRLAPLFSSFGKKGVKPQPYVEEPYPINKQDLEEAERKKEKMQSDRALRYMQMQMVQSELSTKKGSEASVSDD